jgi:N6-L-threonylcarbamoyladenine synthase
MEAHLFATQLEHPDATPPFVALLVSGGHTLLLWVPAWGEYVQLGATRDDAAGEAFDKAAKILGLPYPGGPSIQRAAEGGDPSRHRFTRPLLNRGQRPEDAEYYDFSFSGLKTALRNRVREVEREGALEAEVPHLAAAFQDAAVDVLATKTMRAVREMDCRRIVLGGGVANSRALRAELTRRLGRARRRLRALAAPLHRQSGDDRACGAVPLRARRGVWPGPQCPRRSPVSRGCASAEERRGSRGGAETQRKDENPLPERSAER